MEANPRGRRKRTILEVDSDLDPVLLAKEKAGSLSAAEQKELKRQRRILKNRLAAQKFRQRQREHLETLETQVREEQKKNTDMKAEIEQLKSKNQRTRKEIGKVVDGLAGAGNRNGGNNV